MEGLNYDIMQLIGQEVDCVRETVANRERFGQCISDINGLVEEHTGEELGDRDFTIT